MFIFSWCLHDVEHACFVFFDCFDVCRIVTWCLCVLHLHEINFNFYLCLVPFVCVEFAEINFNVLLASFFIFCVEFSDLILSCVSSKQFGSRW